MIAYFDTSALLRLLLDDEQGSGSVDDLWLAADVLVTAGIAYVEARAALAAAHRAKRITASGLRSARTELGELWAQLEEVLVIPDLLRAAGDLAETERLRGYDAVHLAAALRVGAHVFVCAGVDLCAAARRRGMAIT